LGGNAQKGQGRRGIHGTVYLASAIFSRFFALGYSEFDRFGDNRGRNLLK